MSTIAFSISTMSTNSSSNTSMFNTTASTPAADLTKIYARYIPISIAAIIINLTLLIGIFSTRELRVNPFYWGITSLCVVDFITGIFVIPLGLEYEIEWVWRHSTALCKLYIVADMLRQPVATFIMLFICLERFLARMAVIYAMRETVVKVLSGILVSLPWVILTVICLPIMIAFEKKHDASIYCYFDLQENALVHITSVFFCLPTILLLLAMYGILLTYVYPGERLTRFDENAVAGADDENRLRMSILVTWLVGIISATLWMPIVATAAYFVSCTRSCCKATWEDWSGQYLASLMTSVITPCCWLILEDTRRPFNSWINWIKLKVGAHSYDDTVRLTYKKENS